MSNQRRDRKEKACYRRYRTLARSLGARIFATVEGRLFLVGGTPDFERFCSGLSRLREVTSPVQAPTPTDLGFATFCDGELTEHCLHVRSHALKKWLHGLDCQSRRPASKRLAQQIATETEEVNQLRQRLTELHQLRRRLVAGENPPEAPYVLDHEGEQQFAALLDTYSGEHAHSQRTELVARIAFWISGAPAASRFLQAIRPLNLPADQISRVERLRKFRQRLYVWKHRSKNEHRRAIHSEVKAAIKALPHQIVREAKLSPRLRDKTLTEHCELLITRCTAALGGLQDSAIYRVPSEIAAFATCDGCVAELPTRLIRQFAVDNDFGVLHNAIRFIYHERGNPGYNELLLALDCLHTLPDPSQYKSVRNLLAKRVPLYDVEWAQQQNLLHWLDKPCLQPNWARSFMAALEPSGIKLNHDEFTDVLNGVQKPVDLRLLDQWAQWLRLLTPATITPKVRDLLVKSLLEQLVPCMSGLACSGQLNNLLRPPARGCFDVDGEYDASPELGRWLHRIGYYQRVSRKPVGVPKSVRKHLDANARLNQEQGHLRKLQRLGIANEKQTARLRHLEGASKADGRANESRLLRDAETVYVMMALDAIRTTLHDAALNRWHRTVGFELPRELAARAVEMAQWALRMDETQRQTLSNVLRAWTDHGDEYKSRIPANAQWLQRAVARGIDLAQWLAPDDWQTQFCDREVTIGVSREPFRTFLMGALFNTCLSFGGCNEMSLLANAHDANKQVVYMWDARGKTLARQLVVVSKDFQLLGYHCYSVAGNDKQDARDDIIGKMAMFCGRWTRRCGITLADEGEPAPIGAHFWYDDGVWDWHASGKEAWADQNRPPEEPHLATSPTNTPVSALA